MIEYKLMWKCCDETLLPFISASMSGLKNAANAIRKVPKVPIEFHLITLKFKTSPQFYYASQCYIKRAIYAELAVTSRCHKYS